MELENGSMADTQIAHLAGAFDEAGILNVNIAEIEKYTVGYDFRPLCKFTHSPESEDDPLFGSVLEYCEKQGVIAQTYETETGSQMVEIKQPDQIERFLAPLSHFLLSKYDKVGVMLNEIIPAVREQKHREKKSFYELMEHVDKFNTQHGRVKYDQAYFKEEWDL